MQKTIEDVEFVGTRDKYLKSLVLREKETSELVWWNYQWITKHLKTKICYNKNISVSDEDCQDFEQSHGKVKPQSQRKCGKWENNRWCSEISVEIQKIYDCNDSKVLYDLIRLDFGP